MVLSPSIIPLSPEQFVGRLPTLCRAEPPPRTVTGIVLGSGTHFLGTAGVGFFRMLRHGARMTSAWVEFDCFGGETGVGLQHTQQVLAFAAAIGKSSVGVPDERTERAQTSGH